MRARARSGSGYNSIITENQKWLNESETVKKERRKKKIIATVCSVLPMESGEGKKNLTSHLISCGFRRCVWFEQCVGTWRMKNAAVLWADWSRAIGSAPYVGRQITFYGHSVHKPEKHIKKKSSDFPSSFAHSSTVYARLPKIYW